MSQWRKEFTHYPELVLNDQPNGKCTWIGRIYNYAGPAKIAETQTGIAGSREEASKAATTWVTEKLENYRRKTNSDREVFLITSDDVETLNVKDLGL